MRITCRLEDTIAEIFVGKRSVQSIAYKIETLRQACDQGSDILTSFNVYFANTVRWDTFPIIVLLHKGATPYGALLLHGAKKFGVFTGVVSAGHLCGRGTAIATTAIRPAVVEIAARVLIRNFLAHTVAIRLLRCDLNGYRLDEVAIDQSNDQWRLREMHSRINLENGMDGLMAQLSHKMRRNLRYYRRQAEKSLGCVFIPQLSASQSQAAVEALYRNAAFPLPGNRALQYESVLRTSPNSFAMGLQDGSGNWLSFLAGWRDTKTIYIEWQLNLAQHKTASLANVMRFYCLEHEVNQGTTDVVFVGGTTPMWLRAFVPQICSDLFVYNRFVDLLIQELNSWLSPSIMPSRRWRSMRWSNAKIRTGGQGVDQGMSVKPGGETLGSQPSE